MTDKSQSRQNVPDEVGQYQTDRLWEFAEAIPIPVVLLTSETHVRYANTAFVQALNLGDDHYRHQKLPAHWLTPPEEGLAHLHELLHHVAEGQTCPEPIRLSLRASDGSEIPAEVHARPLSNLDRGPDRLTVVTFTTAGPSKDRRRRDRSKEDAIRRPLRDELERSEERLRLLFEYAPDAFFLHDLKGTFVDGNRAAEKIVGYTREELIGKSFLELNLLPAHQIPKVMRSLTLNAMGKPAGPDEITLRCKDGSEVLIEVSSYPVRLEGQVLVLGTARDITEQKRAQQAILQEKAFSDSVINSLPGVFYMIDETGKYAWWNKHLEEITEYTSEEIPRIHPLELFVGPDRDRAKQAIAKVFEEGTASVEADLVAKSGRKIPYFLTGRRVVRDGKPYLVGLGIDITERRQAQMVLEKLNADLESSVSELERSNQELSDFAHITAHDLKAPLRGIATLADWLDTDYAEKLGPEGRENLHLLRGRVERMGRLINGILRYSEIGHGDEPLELLDTQTLAREVIEQIAPPDHIEVRIEGTLPSVKAERTRLTQVFQNLISNAVKYIDKPRGEIRISACEDGDFWRFSIADNGPGIAAKHFARIFQMFQTLTPSNHGDSTGLGLAVVKKIVDLHGGRVWLESQMGEGTTFFFTLPKTTANIALKED